MADHLTQNTMLGYANNGNEGSRMTKGRSFTATGGNTLSFMSTLGDISSSYEGYWVECLGATNVRNEKQWRIIDDATASGTGLFQLAWPAAIASGDKFQVYTSMGDPVVVADAQGDTTTVNASNRTEAEDFWNDYEMIYLNGEDGIADYENQTVSAFNATTDAFTVDTAFTGTSLAADVAILRRFLAAQEVSFTPDLPGLERPLQRNTFAKLADVRAGYGGSLSFKVEFTPSATQGATGTVPAATALDHLLWGGLGGQSLASTDTVDTISGTSFQVDGAGSFAVQDAAVCGSEMRWKTAATTINEAFVNSYNTNDLARGTRNYYVDTSTQKHHTFDFFADGLRIQGFCCKLTGLTLEASNGTIPMLSFTFAVGHWIATDEANTASVAEIDDIVPNPVYGSAMYLNGTGLTCSDFSLDFGIVAGPVPCQGDRNGAAGFLQTDMNPTASVTVKFDDMEQYHEWARDAKVDCFWHAVNEGAGVGVWFRAQITSVSAPTDNGGVYYATIALKIIEQSTKTWKEVILSLS